MEYIRVVMQTVQIFNVTKGVVIAQQAQLAVSLGQRMKGLLGRSELPANQALVLKPCSSIHTFFMRFPIDVLFLNKNMQIIKSIQNIPPNHLSPVLRASQMVIELPAGKISQSNTQVGDMIEFQQCSLG